MSRKLFQQEDASGNKYCPLTRSTAVYMENGDTLEEAMTKVNGSGYELVTYTGTGEDQSVTLDYKPICVIAFTQGQVYPYIRTQSAGNNVGVSCITITDVGFDVTATLSASETLYSALVFK